jgi:hypothetical protein
MNAPSYGDLNFQNGLGMDLSALGHGFFIYGSQKRAQHIPPSRISAPIPDYSQPTWKRSIQSTYLLARGRSAPSGECLTVMPKLKNEMGTFSSCPGGFYDTLAHVPVISTELTHNYGTTRAALHQESHQAPEPTCRDGPNKCSIIFFRISDWSSMFQTLDMDRQKRKRLQFTK